MNNRKPAFLIMCAAESLRACLAFSAFLPLIQKDALRANLLAAVMASPQPLVPLMWYYLWRGAGRDGAFRNLIIAAKILSAIAGAAWAAAFLAGLARSGAVADNQIIGSAAFWGIVVIGDFVLTGASFFITRGIQGEED